jgi:endonuclease/exonuclease/phosphatase family metal-dependent hydrolase
MQQLRLVCWNIRSLRDDAALVAATLRHLDPDVVCLQEVPRFVGGARALHRLVTSARLSIAVRRSPARPLAVLVRPGAKVGRTVAVPLSRTPGLHRRSFAAAEVSLVGCPPLVVASFHLGLRSDERLRHVPEILSVLATFGEVPRVLAGDVNETAAAPAWRALVDAGLTDAGAAEDAPTSSAARPRRRIDGVFVSAGLSALSCRPPEDVPGSLARASDHLPLVCELRFDPAG